MSFRSVQRRHLTNSFHMKEGSLNLMMTTTTTPCLFPFSFFFSWFLLLSSFCISLFSSHFGFVSVWVCSELMVCLNDIQCLQVVAILTRKDIHCFANKTSWSPSIIVSLDRNEPTKIQLAFAFSFGCQTNNNLQYDSTSDIHSSSSSRSCFP